MVADNFLDTVDTRDDALGPVVVVMIGYYM